MSATVVDQFRLRGSVDKQSASVDFDSVMSYFYQLLKDSKLVEGEDSSKLKEIHFALGGDGRKTGANLRSVVLAAKLFPVDSNGKPLAPMPTPTSQDALFPLLIAKCNEKQEELEVVCKDVLRRLEEVQAAGGWRHPITGTFLPIKLFVIGDMKWLLECTGHKSANSKDFCMYCFCQEANRYDLTTKHEITRLSNFEPGEAGKKHDKSLFHFIPIEHHVPDLLHMMLRVSGRFANALIREIIEGMPKTPCNGALAEKWMEHSDRVQEFERLLRNDLLPGAAGAGGARLRGPGSRVVSGVKIRWNDDLDGGRGDYEWTGLDRGTTLRALFTEVKNNKLNFDELLLPGRWQRIKHFWLLWHQQFQVLDSQHFFTAEQAQQWEDKTREVFRIMTDPDHEGNKPHPELCEGGRWKCEAKLPTSVVFWRHTAEMQAAEPPGPFRWKRRAKDKTVRRVEDGTVVMWKDVCPQPTYLATFITPYIHLLCNHVAALLALHHTLYFYTCQSLELLNNLQSLFYFKRNSRRASWMEELLTAHYRARYLSLLLKNETGWQLQQWKFECKTCGKRYFYEGCFDKHVAVCRKIDYDFSDILVGLDLDRIQDEEMF